MKPIDPYRFDFIGGKDNSYLFTTSEYQTYEIRFKPSGYLFDEGYPFVDSFYELVLLPIKGEASKKLSFDTRIPATVTAIVREFLTQKETVLLYICENKDGRGDARNRKFNQWFELYGLPYHFKFDFEISNADERYLNSVVGRIDNPFRVEIIKACFELAECNSK